jgi:hypothetical protein
MKCSWLILATCLLALPFARCDANGAAWTPPGMGINYGGLALSTVTMSPEAAVELMTSQKIAMVKVSQADEGICEVRLTLALLQ